jgi:type I restriction enzyme S subunit
MGDWIDFKIGDIVLNIADGGTPSRHDPTNFGNEINWVVITDIQDDIFETKEKLSQKGFSKCSSLLWKPGSIILSTGATIGEVGITRVYTATKQGISGIEVKDELVISEYLKYWFQLNKEKIKVLAQGSTIKEIRPSTIVKIPIKIPRDKKAQSTIVTIITTIDQAIEKTEQLIAKYERIKTGLMQDLLTRGIDERGNIRSEKTHEFKDSPLGRIPKEWEVVNFGQYVELVHGYQFRNYDFTDAGIPIVKISQVTESGLDISSCSFIDRNRLGDFEKQVIHNEDVLMALTGATLGKACFVSGLSIPVLQNYRVGRFEPLNSEEVDKTYLYYTLTTKEFLNQIFSKVNTGAQGNIGKADFVKAKFKLPSFQEQHKIGQLLNGIQKLIEEESLNLEKNKILKTGIMQDLLTGKVRVDALMNQNSIS